MLVSVHDEGTYDIRPVPDPASPTSGCLRRSLTGLLIALTLVLAVQATAVVTRPEPTVVASASPTAPALDPSTALVRAVQEVLPAVVTVVQTAASGQTVGSGTGVVIDRARGHVVTNSHVVEDPRSTRSTGTFVVILSDGSRLPATVIGHDPETDIAVLHVSGSLPAEARLATTAPQLGSQVIAIGSPGTGRPSGLLANTVTAGIVSGLGRSLPRPDVRNVLLTDLIQTDAAINVGMSGGPLVDVATREVIGLNTLVFRAPGEEGLGFAISSLTVGRVAMRLIGGG